MIPADLREALVEAEASPERATKAAAEVADFEKRLAGMDVKTEEIKGGLKTAQWMLGALIAANSAVMVTALVRTLL